MRGSTWIGKLYSKSKWLAVIAAAFFFLTVFFNIIQLETTPFFVWDMYKNPVRDTSVQQVYLIQYNKNTILNFKHTLKEPQKIYLSSPLFYYLSWKENGNKEIYPDYKAWAAKHPSFNWVLSYLGNSEAAFNSFPDWYRRYLSSITGDDISSVEIIKKQLQFQQDHSVKELNSATIPIFP